MYKQLRLDLGEANEYFEQEKDAKTVKMLKQKLSKVFAAYRAIFRKKIEYQNSLPENANNYMYKARKPEEYIAWDWPFTYDDPDHPNELGYLVVQVSYDADYESMYKACKQYSDTVKLKDQTIYIRLTEEEQRELEQ